MSQYLINRTDRQEIRENFLIQASNQIDVLTFQRIKKIGFAEFNHSAKRTDSERLRTTGGFFAGLWRNAEQSAKFLQYRRCFDELEFSKSCEYFRNCHAVRTLSAVSPDEFMQSGIEVSL